MSTIRLQIVNAQSQTAPTYSLYVNNVLQIPAVIFESKNMDEYEDYIYHQNFMQPADQWTIKVGAEHVREDTKGFLVNNNIIELYVGDDDGNNNRIVCCGYIDQIKLHNYREGKPGTYYEIRGRSKLAQAIDDGIDPWSKTFEFIEGTTFGQMMTKIFAQYGLQVIYDGTDVKDRDIVTGVNRSNPNTKLITDTITVSNEEQEAFDEGFLEGPPAAASTYTVTHWYDPTAPTNIEQLPTKKLKPQPHETAYSFAETQAKRFNLHIWDSVEQNAIVIGKPDYTQNPTFTFTNRYDGQGNNVHESWVEIDSVNMPAAIIAKGKVGGGDFNTTTIKCCKVNEFLGYIPGAYNAFQQNGSSVQFNSQFIKPSILARIDRFKALPILDPVSNLLLLQQGQGCPQFFNQNDVKTAVVYWHDTYSLTQAQLESAVQRRMSEFMRNAVRVHIKVDDHQQNGSVFRYNTIANINDEKLGINVPMWIEDVVFRKSRQEGTVTELVLTPINVLFFGGTANNNSGKSALAAK